MEENKVIDVTPEETVEVPEVKYAQLVIDKNDKKYVFCIPDGSPIGEAYDACFQALDQLAKMATEAAAKMAPNNEAEVQDAVQ